MVQSIWGAQAAHMLYVYQLKQIFEFIAFVHDITKLMSLDEKLFRLIICPVQKYYNS